jgi:hypothetical protein
VLTRIANLSERQLCARILDATGMIQQAFLRPLPDPGGRCFEMLARSSPSVFPPGIGKECTLAPVK